MRLHTVRGEAILNRACRSVEGLNYLELGAVIARSHHERFDGGGYPDGLAGEAIPLAARILAVADSYDAMVSPRPYRPAHEHAAALAEIRAGAGSRFDPVVVEAFLAIAGDGGVTP